MSRYQVERKTLSEQVAEQLETEILEGRLSENAQLPSERELMEQFGVGRPAVREALFYLQRLGLIAINSGTRARVIRPTAEAVMSRLSGVTRQLLSKPDGQQYFQEARAMFEISLARYAAVNASEEDLQRLRRNVQRRFLRSKNADAIGPAGQDHGLNTRPRQHGPSIFFQRSSGIPPLRASGAKLCPVGGKHSRAGIASPIALLGIQYR